MTTSLYIGLPASEKQAIDIQEIEINIAGPDFSTQPVILDQAKKDVGKASKIHTETSAFDNDDVHVVGMDGYKQAARSLAEAFADDEVARYFTHTPDREHWDDARKWDLHVSILEYIVYAHVLNGLVLTSGPDYGCIALWYVAFLTLASIAD